MGPIERYSRMRSQFESARKIDFQKMAEGFFLIAFGCFKKMVIADRLIFAGEQIWKSTPSFGLPEAVLFLFLSFFVLYTDFSGYTDIARGLAKILGFDLVENFCQPYLARNLGDFMMRWHFSLTSWVRDFIYWPVVLKTRQIFFGVIVSFVFLAFWHGLQLSCWMVALYFCLTYVGYLIRRRMAPASRMPSKLRSAISSLILILLVSGSLIVALAGTPQNLFLLLSQKLKLSGQNINFGAFRMDLFIVAMGLALIVAFETMKNRKYFFCLAGGALLVILTIGFGVSSSRYFIYMRY